MEEAIQEKCGTCKRACVEKYDLRCGFCTSGFNPVCLGLVNENLALLLNAIEILNIDYYCSPCKEKISGFAVKCSEENLPEEEPLPLRVTDSESDIPENEVEQPQNPSDEHQEEHDVQTPRRSQTNNEERPVQENREVGPINQTVEVDSGATPDRGTPITRANIRVCKFHVKGNCKYNGDVCKFYHPVLCKHYTTYGECKFENRCNYYHHQICKAVLKERYCKFENNCSFLHPKKTLKRPMNNNYYEAKNSGFRDGQVLNFFQEMYDMMTHMQERRVNSRAEHIPWKRENLWRNY